MSSGQWAVGSGQNTSVKHRASMKTASEIDYQAFEDLILKLRQSRYETTADKLDSLLHLEAWTSSSELVGELGLEIVAFDRSASNVPAEVQNGLKRCLAIVRKVWPDIGRGEQT